MSTGQHTPGPWVTDTDGDGKPFAIVTSTHDKDGPDDVCEVYGGNADDDSVRKANAHLIAAAPDLLEALKRLLNAGSDPYLTERGVRNLACAVIRKAEGRAPGAADAAFLGGETP